MFFMVVYPDFIKKSSLFMSKLFILLNVLRKCLSVIFTGSVLFVDVVDCCGIESLTGTPAMGAIRK